MWYEIWSASSTTWERVVIVEGVEEEWQYEKLLDYNCDMIQGYLFGGPLQAGEVHGVEVHTASAASGELR